MAIDLRSGAVRYLIVRSSRAEWSIAKYVGQALLIGLALGVSALGAWGVAACRLSGGAGLLPSMFGWSLRAWLYSLAWMGMALGLSHITRSGGFATALGIFAFVALSVFPQMLQVNAEWLGVPWLENFDVLVPVTARGYLWRRGTGALSVAAAHLLILGFTYLALGYAVFRRKDA